MLYNGRNDSASSWGRTAMSFDVVFGPVRLNWWSFNLPYIEKRKKERKRNSWRKNCGEWCRSELTQTDSLRSRTSVYPRHAYIFGACYVASVDFFSRMLLPLTWASSGDRIIVKKKDDGHDDCANLVSSPILSLVHFCGMSKRLAWMSISRMTCLRQLGVVRAEMMKIEGVIRARCGESPRSFLPFFCVFDLSVQIPTRASWIYQSLSA